MADTSWAKTWPFRGGFDITAGQPFPDGKTTRGIMVTAEGDVDVEFESGDTLVLPNLQPGTYYPFELRAVNAAGTTATGIKGLY